jgi:hypothetical protein
MSTTPKALRQSNKIRLITRNSAFSFAHSVPSRVLKLLEVCDDFGAEFDVVTPNQVKAAPKVFVDGPHCLQLSLLSACGATEAVTLSNQALNGGRPSQCRTL